MIAVRAHGKRDHEDRCKRRTCAASGARCGRASTTRTRHDDLGDASRSFVKRSLPAHRYISLHDRVNPPTHARAPPTMLAPLSLSVLPTFPCVHTQRSPCFRACRCPHVYRAIVFPPCPHEFPPRMTPDPPIMLPEPLPCSLRFPACPCAVLPMLPFLCMHTCLTFFVTETTNARVGTGRSSGCRDAWERLRGAAGATLHRSDGNDESTRASSARDPRVLTARRRPGVRTRGAGGVESHVSG